MLSKILSKRLATYTPICLDYSELLSTSDLSHQILSAYGSTGLGILTVKNIPNFPAKRNKLLPLAHLLATLPQSAKDPLELPITKYSVGWSHGKEHYGGLPDFSKGSFYANPEIDFPPIPHEWSPNVWPKSALPELEPAFKSLGQEIIRVGGLLAKHLDLFIGKHVKNYADGSLHHIISTHQSHVGRLLHYFPQQGSAQNWCGWHNDHGALTGLTSSMYIDQATGEIRSASEIAAEKVGLFVRNRKGETIKIKADADMLCFQIGETAQILSGGLLQATPHAVMTEGKLGNISRNTFAIFMEPRGHFLMKTDNDAGVFIEHDGVPSLKKRWKQGMTFGEFHRKTLEFFN